MNEKKKPSDFRRENVVKVQLFNNWTDEKMAEQLGYGSVGGYRQAKRGYVNDKGNARSPDEEKVRGLERKLGFPASCMDYEQAPDWPKNLAATNLPSNAAALSERAIEFATDLDRLPAPLQYLVLETLNNQKLIAKLCPKNIIGDFEKEISYYKRLAEATGNRKKKALEAKKR